MLISFLFMMNRTTERMKKELYIWCLKPLNKLNTEMYIWCLKPLNKLNIEIFYVYYNELYELYEVDLLVKMK